MAKSKLFSFAIKEELLIKSRENARKKGVSLAKYICDLLEERNKQQEQEKEERGE